MAAERTGHPDQAAASVNRSLTEVNPLRAVYPREAQLAPQRPIIAGISARLCTSVPRGCPSTHWRS